VVRSNNRAFEKGDEVEDVVGEEVKREVQHGRNKITRLILERAAQVMPAYGIELVDVQIQRINYVNDVQAKVFDRMISERKRIADRHRSEGQGKSAEIRGKKERELKVIESDAYRQGQEIMGRGDAQAASIYADAFNRDRDLYKFSRTLQTYRDTIDKESVLILSTNAEIYRYLRSSSSSSSSPGRRSR
jgi:membrane protease subunit HflC